MELYKITKQALKEYRTEVRNNKYDSKLTARKKLTRNTICGSIVNQYLNFRCYGYGSMRIYILNDTIIHIQNKIEPKIWIDFRMKKELNKELGIDVITFGDKIKRLLRVG